MKMSKAEAGSLGAMKAKITLANKRAVIFDQYNKTPTLCKKCQEPLPYVVRRNTFCSRSCSVSYHLTGKPTRNSQGKNADGLYGMRKPKFCKRCDQPRPKGNNTFCSKECDWHYKRDLIHTQIEKGLITQRPTIKRALIEKRGHQCERCAYSEWMGAPIPLELDHIDGDAGNNLPNNLRLLCPTCHAQMPTSKGGNRGKGRKSRGLPVA